MESAPVMAAPPQTVHDRDGFLVWHSGFVLSPHGDLVTLLEVSSRSGHDFLTDPAWDLMAREEFPVRATARAGDGPEIAGSVSEKITKRGVFETVRFRGFGTRIPDGSVAEFVILPLAIEFTVPLDGLRAP
ncbi:hypothetical protein [Catenuloplanes atrovinosus]|uniref:Uncharacterized protein n=1 Tax=Catenuloplanes atrovinosus TaxID=137266 RepID=A0AAE3YMX4_9ACTN|nr:hypothetical protein [Catenuloplanes atrovinosus]MDR7276022.1 hypothetical protein [Catenuloplanes atrovinosus]